MKILQSELVETEYQTTIMRKELPDLPEGLKSVTLYFTEHGAWNGIYRANKLADKKDTEQLAVILPDEVLSAAIALATPMTHKHVGAKRLREAKAKRTQLAKQLDASELL